MTRRTTSPARSRLDTHVAARSRVTSLLFVSSLQYFVVQFVVAGDWPRPYSFATNTISDLGNTACAPFHRHYVCSPLHAVMNVSLVVLGVTMCAGALVFRRDRVRSRTRSLGLAFIVIAGAGVITVGLFPENTLATLHAWGASLPFVVGNFGLVALGVTWGGSRVARLLTVVTGLVALTAVVFYSQGQYLGLGEGGLERIVAYPQTLWLIILGAALWRGPTRQERTIPHADSLRSP